jgi:hypothetical protein
VGDHHLRGLGPGHPPGLAGDPAQDARDELQDGHFALAEPDGALFDAALRVGLEPVWLQARRMYGVTPGEDRSVGVDVDGGGQQRRAVEEQRFGPAVRPAQHRDRVRGAEVDA